MPLMRCGFISRGTTPAFTSDDLPEPLAPDTNRKALSGARIGSKLLRRLDHRGVAPEEDRRMLEFVGLSPRNGSPSQIGACDIAGRHAS